MSGQNLFYGNPKVSTHIQCGATAPFFPTPPATQKQQWDQQMNRGYCAEQQINSMASNVCCRTAPCMRVSYLPETVAALL
jgi:hypothetical protein